jgi:tRNA nucleotidyltransferase/poly(A) polymerase
MKDLEIGLLRFPSKQVVVADPVRLLRIYRFAAQLSFDISQNAIDLVTAYRSMLSDVAAERCRDELMKIFYVKKAYPYLQQMDATGLLTQVVPTVKETRRAWASLQTFEESPIPLTLHAYRKEINRYLQEELSVDTNRRSLIKLSLLLGGNLGGIGEHLRFSRKAMQFMERIISGSQTLKNIIRELTQKQINRFLRTYMSDWWGILLYFAAAYPIDLATLKRIADTYYGHILPICKQGRLITGDDLIQEFHLKEGEQIGDLLKEVEDRQFDGEIRTREEAFAAVAALIQSARA